MAAASRFPPLTREEMSAEQREVHDRIASGPRAGVRGPYHALLRHPKLAKSQEIYGAHVRYDNALPEPLKELAILVTARHWNAQYAWCAHRQIAEKVGVAPSVCDALARGEKPAGIDAETAAIVDFATMLLRTGAVDDATFDGVKTRFGDKGVLDLIALIGNYTTVAFILNIDRHPIPEGANPMPDLG